MFRSAPSAPFLHLASSIGALGLAFVDFTLQTPLLEPATPIGHFEQVDRLQSGSWARPEPYLCGLIHCWPRDLGRSELSNG